MFTKEIRPSRIPNLFIVGAPKAGTTALVDQLATHAEIFVPEVKEPHYFFKNLEKGWYYYKAPMITSDNKFNELYNGAEKYKYKVDGSVHYLRFSDVVSEEIRSVTRNCKIIVMIREPSQRIISHYLMDERSGLVKNQLSAILDGENKYKDEYIECSLYYERINYFISMFGNNNVLVIDFEDYINCNSSVMKKVCDFLVVAKKDFSITASNQYRRPKLIVKYIYQFYLLRKIYNKIVPDDLKNFLRGIFLSKDKPDLSNSIREDLLKKLQADYAKTKEYYVKSEG